MKNAALLVALLTIALFALTAPVFAIMECTEYGGGTMYYHPLLKYYICSGAGGGGGCTVCYDVVTVP